MLEAFASGGAVNKPPKSIFKQLQPVEFITGSALSTLVGAGAMGTAMSEIDTTPWLIIRETTKVYAIPQKPLRHSVGYRAMQNNGLLYGKNVTIQGGTWTVRTFSGVDGNTGEWMRIMAGLVSGALLQNGSKPPIRWANLTFDDIGVGPLNTASQALSVYIQETYNNYQYYTQGGKGVLYSLYNQNMDTTFASNGWRPLLQWVSGSQPWV